MKEQQVLLDIFLEAINPRTYKGGGGGRGGCHPPEGFAAFFLNDKSSQHMKFSIAVRLSFA